MTSDNPTSIHLWADGSVVDSQAGVGYTLKTQGNEIAWGYNKIPDVSSSTHAEAWALIKGLEEASKYEAICLYIFMDSESVINLVDPSEPDSARDKSLNSLVDQAQSFFEKFEEVIIEHKSSVLNERADELASRAHRLGENESECKVEIMSP